MAAIEVPNTSPEIVHVQLGLAASVSNTMINAAMATSKSMGAGTLVSIAIAFTVPSINCTIPENKDKIPD